MISRVRRFFIDTPIPLRIFWPDSITDKNGALHSESNGRFVRRGEGQGRAEELHKGSSVPESYNKIPSTERVSEYLKNSNKKTERQYLGELREKGLGSLYHLLRNRIQTEKQAWVENLPKPEAKAINSYSKSSVEINSALRTGKKQNEKVREEIQKIDSVMANSTLQRDVVVYRGVAKAEYCIKDGVFFDKGFCSTSPNASVAVAYADKAPVILALRLPKGLHAVCVINYAAHPEEEEILLDRGVRGKLRGKPRHSKGSTIYDIDVELPK